MDRFKKYNIPFKVHGVFLICLVAIACAKVNFTGGRSCNGAAGCTTILGNNVYDYTVSPSNQPIDVLFVVDNSASMYSIQQSIGQKFPSLFSSLSQFNYHVAVTTTDISDASLNPPRSINQSGALQNGALIRLTDGTAFISPSSSSPQSLFASAITRPETLTCQNWVSIACPNGCTDLTAYHNQCPSEDTRAIVASQMTLQNDTTGFIRPNVPLAVVMVSNADERASGGLDPNEPALTSKDMPQALMKVAANLNKPLTVYPIIIEPNDSSCNDQQKFSPFIFGWYGNIYNQLASQTGGSSSSICASDFSANLKSIGQGISNSLKAITLNCTPINNTVTVTFPDGTVQTLTTSDSAPTVLNLPTTINLGQSVRLKYSCSITN